MPSTGGYGAIGPYVCPALLFAYQAKYAAGSGLYGTCVVEDLTLAVDGGCQG